MVLIQNRLPSGFTAGLLTVLALGGLSACNDDQETESTGTGSDKSSSEPSSTGSEADDADGDDTDAAQNASPTGCLVGTWLADNKQLGALFKSASGTDAAGAVSDPTGKVLATFGAQGEYGVDYQNWTMKVSQQGMTIELVREGTDTGKYQATDEGAVEWTEVTMGSVATMKSPAGSRQVPGEATSTSGTFVCEGDNLEITAEGNTSAFDRQ